MDDHPDSDVWCLTQLIDPNPQTQNLWEMILLHLVFTEDMIPSLQPPRFRAGSRCELEVWT
jgi:hypothetical protein